VQKAAAQPQQRVQYGEMSPTQGLMFQSRQGEHDFRLRQV
jgi:hypothetical protein